MGEEGLVLVVKALVGMEGLRWCGGNGGGGGGVVVMVAVWW